MMVAVRLGARGERQGGERRAGRRLPAQVCARPVAYARGPRAPVAARRAACRARRLSCHGRSRERIFIDVGVPSAARDRGRDGPGWPRPGRAVALRRRQRPAAATLRARGSPTRWSSRRATAVRSRWRILRADAQPHRRRRERASRAVSGHGEGQLGRAGSACAPCHRPGHGSGAAGALRKVGRIADLLVRSGHAPG